MRKIPLWKIVGSPWKKGEIRLEVDKWNFIWLTFNFSEFEQLYAQQNNLNLKYLIFQICFNVNSNVLISDKKGDRIHQTLQSWPLRQNKLFEIEFGESHRVNLCLTGLSQSGALVLSSNVLDFLLPKSQLKLHCCDVLLYTSTSIWVVKRSWVFLIRDSG